MVALKGDAVARFLRRPDRNLVLVYGPDAGLVAERSCALIASVDTAQDPFAQVTLTGDALAAEPQRLAEEAWTVPLFGGRRAVRVMATSRNILPAVEPLLSTPPQDALVVVEAGDLKAAAPLRRLFERSADAACIPCYIDDDRSLDQLVDEVLGQAGLQVSSDARDLLRSIIGGDRLASRRELEKLALYCLGQSRVEAEDVAAISGDASAIALDVLVDAAALGDTGESDRMLRKALAAGTAPASIVSALSRHFLQLEEARRRVDGGDTAESAMRALRPPVFYKRQQAFRRQINRWPGDAIARASDLIGAAELETRRRPDLAAEIVGRCLLALGGAARPARR